MNREDWLTAMIELLRPMFSAAGHAIPEKVRASVGWPSNRALSDKRRVIGQCWGFDSSEDKHVEIFISPYIGTALDAAETLAHELIHATGAHGHQGDFVTIAKAIGFTKPWKSTPATPELKERLNALIAQVGTYPHARVNGGPTHKKDSTRMRKVVCGACGYTVRTTAKWLEVGLPTCACGEEMKEAS